MSGDTRRETDHQPGLRGGSECHEGHGEAAAAARPRLPPDLAEKEAEKLRQRFARISKAAGLYRTPQKRRLPFVALIILAFLAGFLAVLVQPHLPPTIVLRHYAAAPNCGLARLVKLAPARRGDPGYWPRHDADNDGIACEPVPSTNVDLRFRSWSNRESFWQLHAVPGGPRTTRDLPQKAPQDPSPDQH
ncbi:excalibur calcium-binding domain-containing protein [Afifella sp. H1R]|nr:excalibur calcium-binding domain-containing protein [Afifella sp. H1R]MCF1502271.1 excalibur calcium-binding domain-containing protein [Afifella sp. H1R]